MIRSTFAISQNPFAPDVTKTRSGKILRRVLKALVRHEPVGDLTTLQNPESVDRLKELVG